MKISAELVIGCLAAMVLSVAACAGNRGSSSANPSESPSSNSASASAQAPAGPIDMCGIITPQVAASVLGPLPQQPPSKTDSAGFGIYDCMYIGPRLSGQGAQTVFSRLTVSAGSGKDAGDMLQMDAEKQHATADLSGVGDSAKRNANGTFIWAKKGERYCTAQISNSLPSSLTPDQAAAKLGDLCQKLLAK